MNGSCLRRDAGVFGELHELDQQINDLRLDTEVSQDQLETDSRASSVFSECFCSTAEAEGYFLSTDELAGCLEYDVLGGGLCDDSSSFGAVCHSLSAPSQASLEATSLVPTECPSKTFCHLFTRNVSDIYCHRSPLHAAATKGSGFLQISGDGGHCRDEAGAECLKTQTFSTPSSFSGSLGAQSSTFQPHSSKHPEKYIFGLLQRRVQPMRANRPRTSISTDPLKSIVRQPSLCLRQVFGPSSGVGTLKGSEVKSLFPAEETSAEFSSSQRQCSIESKNKEEISNWRVLSDDTDTMQFSSKINKGDSNSPAGHNMQNICSLTSRVKNTSTKRVISETSNRYLSLPGASVPILLKDIIDQRSPEVNYSHKETCQPCCPTDQEHILKSALTAKTQTGASKKISKPCQSCPSENNNWELAHSRSKPFAQNLKEGEGVEGQSHVGNGIPAKQHNRKHRKVPGKHRRSTPISVRSGVLKPNQYGNYHSHHHHGREQVVVVTKPKYKQKDYRPLCAIMEVPYGGANELTRRRQRKKILRNFSAKMYPTTGRQQSSPYSNVAGSDSEYSAECVSLFHSTILDTSEDDRSNYTTNCFGDSESSEEEYVEENTTTTDTEESVGGLPGGGGAGRCKGHLRTARVTVGKLEIDPAQTKPFVKIKASYNLKKKILRFRSGSLKLMTTV
ncbi:hypothetical protein GOODEAATRI_018488 [Goodea atripinnis]|uniref:Dapper homolog 1 n=1 Tax=Goodea atripinnis TaxID=208336 RepID=A0ABV0NL94_9TELE